MALSNAPIPQAHECTCTFVHMYIQTYTLSTGIGISIGTSITEGTNTTTGVGIRKYINTCTRTWTRAGICRARGRGLRLKVGTIWLTGAQP